MGFDSFEHLVIDVNDGVAIVKMNRPDKLNAFNRRMGLELLQIPIDLRDDPSVRSVILTGTGRGFCTGVDTSEPRDANAENPFHRNKMDEFGYTGRLPTAWHDIDKPTIAAINGIAAGGGLALSLMQDIRIMAESARLIPIFITRGLSPELGVSWFVPRLIGMSRALEWLYTGDAADANTAKEMGLVSRVVADEQLMPAAIDLAQRLAEGPPIGIRLTRRSVYHGVTNTLRDHLPYEAANVSISSVTEDATEGRTALREKRKPNFQGR